MLPEGERMPGNGVFATAAPATASDRQIAVSMQARRIIQGAAERSATSGAVSSGS
jgi:hypothetical protein